MLLPDTSTAQAPRRTETAVEGFRCWWLPTGGVAQAVEPPSPPGGDGVLWVDIDPDTDVHAAAALCARLGIAVAEEQLEDLCLPDEVCRANEGDGQTRHVSTVALHTTTRSHDGHGIAFQVLEIISGPDWLLTCWHSSQPELAGEDPEDVRLAHVVNLAVRGGWAEGRAQTAGDVATELLLQVTQGYKQSCREIEGWLQDWERHFHADQGLDPEPLRHLLGQVIETRRRLAAFNNARAGTSNNRWFGNLTSPDVDERADGLLDHALARLQTTFENIRADMELVCMERMVRQAEVAEATQESDRKFQESLGKVSALLLVPTLIAGVFGANTALPGGGTWFGFDSMVTLMIVTSLGVYWLLVLRGRRTRPE